MKYATALRQQRHHQRLRQMNNLALCVCRRQAYELLYQDVWSRLLMQMFLGWKDGVSTTVRPTSVPRHTVKYATALHHQRLRQMNDLALCVRRRQAYKLLYQDVRSRLCMLMFLGWKDGVSTTVGPTTVPRHTVNYATALLNENPLKGRTSIMGSAISVRGR